MQKSPVTEKVVIGIPEESYADARHRAHYEEKERWKSKTKKDKVEKIPLFKVGAEVVCIGRGWKSTGRDYYLIEVVDFNELRFGGGFEYYGILRDTTNEKMEHRIGRFIMFNESTQTWSRDFVAENVPKESIKWR